MAAQFGFPSAVSMYQLLYILQHLTLSSLLNFNHSSGWGVVSYYDFNLYFCHLILNIFLVLSFFKYNF